MAMALSCASAGPIQSRTRIVRKTVVAGCVAMFCSPEDFLAAPEATLRAVPGPAAGVRHAAFILRRAGAGALLRESSFHAHDSHEREDGRAPESGIFGYPTH